jgi:hypothetical protein
MPTCPNCGKKVSPRRGNHKKVKGTHIHKLCPGKKSYRRKKREMNNVKLHTLLKEDEDE